MGVSIVVRQSIKRERGVKAERIGCRGRFIVPIADLSALATFLVRLLLFHTTHPYHTIDRLAKLVHSRGRACPRPGVVRGNLLLMTTRPGERNALHAERNGELAA